MGSVERFWYTVLAVILLFLITVLSTQYFSQKTVQNYYLASNQHGISGLQIGVDINYQTDDYIPLVGVSYQEAVALVKRLNEDLRKSHK